MVMAEITFGPPTLVAPPLNPEAALLMRRIIEDMEREMQAEIDAFFGRALTNGSAAQHVRVTERGFIAKDVF
jgi:hypothetical protein